MNTSQIHRTEKPDNLGTIYEAQGKLAEALGLYETALRLRKEIGHLLGQATTRVNFGNLYDIQR